VALNTGFDRETTDLLLAALGWAGGTVDAVVCGDDVPQGRPAPYLIFRAMEAVGATDVQRVAVVGDTVLDLQAGYNAGVGWNIGVLTGAHDRKTLEAAPHTHILASVAEVPGLWQNQPASLTPGFQIEEWDSSHPRYAEFMACLEAVAPEQAPFVAGGGFFNTFPCVLLVALQGQQIAGFLRFAVLPIGPEAHCPTLTLDGQVLVEAKIHAFAVHPDFRNQGIGTALQRHAIRRATQLGCYQLASYSAYGRDANYHVKLALGFAVQPETHGDGEKGVYFMMPLRNPLD
jgi:GNAT superfamily N-acetyltransferase